MEFQHRMKRTALGTIIRRSIADLQTDPERALRRLTDLGQNSFKGEKQQRFIADMQKAIAQPQNPCYALLMRVAQSANPQTLQMLGMNLGYTSFTYGVRILRSQQEVLRHNIPAMLLFDWQGEGQNKVLAQTADLLHDAQELGIFSYIMVFEHSFAELDCAIQLAKQNTECTFLYCMTADMVTDGTAAALGALPNCMVVVRASEHEDLSSACGLLKKYRCVYGFGSLINAANASILLTLEQMHAMLNLGCMYGVFHSSPQDTATHHCIAQFVQAARNDPSLPIFPFDWRTDCTYVTESFSRGNDYLIFRRDGSITNGCENKSCPTFSSLRQAIAQVMPSI